MDKIPEDVKAIIRSESIKEEIYEPKYGGKDHSGYETMMKYEINSERSECFEKGAYFGYSLGLQSAEKRVKELEDFLKQMLKWKYCYDLRPSEKIPFETMIKKVEYYLTQQ